MHHPVFSKFRCWEGNVDEGWKRDFLGSKIRAYFYLAFPALKPGFHRASLPEFGENYLQWVDILEAVVSSSGCFTIIDLGAGFGRVLVHAANAVRQYSGIPFRLIGVEAEPVHFEWMKLCLQDNEIDWRDHQLIQAAVSDQKGEVWFHTGRPDEWYGQFIGTRVSWADRFSAWINKETERITDPSELRDGSIQKRIRTVTLSAILESLDLVDLIDLDIQGSELAVLRSAQNDLKKKVKRVHIGTHSAENESGLRQLFVELGWKNIFDYPLGNIACTPWGSEKFQDGVQTWVNPRFL